jgi:hypothetical protein
MNASELKVKKGEKVRDAWERLVRWVDSLKIVPTKDVEVRQTPHGIIVRVRQDKIWRHPFKVMVGGEEVIINTGTVNGIVPVVDGKGGKRRIDNRDKDGKREEVDPPRLKLNTNKASKDGLIYIALKVKANVSAGIEGVVENKAGEQVSENVEIVQTDSAKGPADGCGYYPLAMIRLAKDRSVEQVFQIVHHNMRYAFQERKPSEGELKQNPELKAVGRHLFLPT